jgi:putative protein-disulfide isomerase
MNVPIIIYCYDAYCGWCFGFSKVITKIAAHYKNQAYTEVISGGMVLPETAVHISNTAKYILNAYPRVEELTGAKFGEDYLWHLKNPEETDWYPHSLMPAKALAIIREKNPDDAVLFAADIQHCLFAEGRDLTDKEAYRHLLEKYHFEADEFYEALASEKFTEIAQYDFALTKQLGIDSFPQVLIQTDESKFHLVAKGYTDFDTLKERIDSVLGAANAAQ